MLCVVKCVSMSGRLLCFVIGWCGRLVVMSVMFLIYWFDLCMVVEVKFLSLLVVSVVLSRMIVYLVIVCMVIVLCRKIVFYIMLKIGIRNVIDVVYCVFVL